jgi:rSAM/selenodomain-associated transferase 1
MSVQDPVAGRSSNRTHPDRYPDCVVLFTKPLRPGHVKTRLIGPLSAEQAAELQAAFLADLTERLRRGRFDLLLAWAVECHEKLPPSPVRSIRQAAGDLGHRLYTTLHQMSAEYRAVAAIGSDHPEIPLSRVHEAFDKLDRQADVVLGPAEDGGYYLIAVRSSVLRPGLFRNIPWSTAEVLEVTRKRCSDLGLQVELLAMGRDVDTERDLASLAAELGRNPQLECPRTRELLESWNRL